MFALFRTTTQGYDRRMQLPHACYGRQVLSKVTTLDGTPAVTVAVDADVEKVAPSL